MKLLNKEIIDGQKDILLTDANLFVDEIADKSDLDFWTKKFDKQEDRYCVVQYLKHDKPVWAIFREETLDCRIVSIDRKKKTLQLHCFDDGDTYSYNYRKCQYIFSENEVLRFKKKNGRMSLVNKNFLVRSVA